MPPKTIGIFVAVSLLSLVLLGILGLSMVDYDSQRFCPISLLSGGNCSTSYRPFAEAFHHISALQNFTQSSANVFSSMLLALLALALIVRLKLNLKIPSRQTLLNADDRNSEKPDYAQKKQFQRWLTLHAGSTGPRDQ